MSELDIFGKDLSSARHWVRNYNRLVDYNKQLLSFKKQKRDTSILVRIITALTDIKVLGSRYSVMGKEAYNNCLYYHEAHLAKIELEMEKLQQSETEVKNKILPIK